MAVLGLCYTSWDLLSLSLVHIFGQLGEGMAMVEETRTESAEERMNVAKEREGAITAYVLSTRPDYGFSSFCVPASTS